MNAEYTCCEECRAKKLCHPNLTPQKLTHTGRIVALDKDKSYADWHCQYFTCPAGARAALAALTEGIAFQAPVVEMDNSIHTVSAVAFGSPHKPTEAGALRIVTTKRHVYSLKNGSYYRSGNV